MREVDSSNFLQPKGLHFYINLSTYILLTLCNLKLWVLIVKGVHACHLGSGLSVSMNPLSTVSIVSLTSPSDQLCRSQQGVQQCPTRSVFAFLQLAPSEPHPPQSSQVLLFWKSVKGWVRVYGLLPCHSRPRVTWNIILLLVEGNLVIGGHSPKLI